DLTQGAEFAGRTLNTLAGLDVEPAVVTVAAYVFTVAVFALMVGNGAGQVRAFLKEGNVVPVLAPDEDGRGFGIGIIEDEPASGSERFCAGNDGFGEGAFLFREGTDGDGGIADHEAGAHKAEKANEIA